MSTFVSQHSALEKTLHRLAFKAWSPLLALSAVEKRVYQPQLAQIKAPKPVFITALPRAGTTLLLELCVKTGSFASHIYGDMPFLLTPLFWATFSKHFRQVEKPQERVHGDRIMVNVNSPEAFEEIIWQGFWPSRYRADRIIPWAEPSYPDFEAFLADHIRKIILLRGGPKAAEMRYISKNNLNIARIAYLKHVFPQAIIVIPFRHPLQHAASLLKQHRNFLKIHQEDPFAQEYMADTGHYDFGENLRPVNFNDWLSTTNPVDSTNLTFWVQYWVSTYRYLLENVQPQATFLSYDALCQNPEKGLQAFGTLLELDYTDSLVAQAKQISPPKAYSINPESIPAALLNEAETLFAALQKVALTYHT